MDLVSSPSNRPVGLDGRLPQFAVGHDMAGPHSFLFDDLAVVGEEGVVPATDSVCTKGWSRPVGGVGLGGAGTSSAYSDLISWAPAEMVSSPSHLGSSSRTPHRHFVEGPIRRAISTLSW